MSGFSLFAGALSNAASDTLKGLRAGEEERRLEEEAGRRARQQMMEEAYAPIRFQRGNLENQALTQNMRLAQSAEERAQAAEGRTVELHGPAVRTAKAGADTAETVARYKESQITKDLAAIDAQIAQANENVRASQETTPALVDHYKRQSDLLTAQRDELLRAYKEKETARLKRIEAIGKLRQIPLSDFNAVANVMAEYGDYFEPTDAFTGMMDNLMKLEMARIGASGQHAMTPFQANSIRQQVRVYAAKQADDQATQLLGLAGKAMGGQTTLDVVSWFEAYYRSIEAKRAMVENPGLTFDPKLLAIPRMPETVKQAIAKDTRWFPSWRGTLPARQILDFAEPYLMSGMEYNEALTLGERLYNAKRSGAPTPPQPSSQTPEIPQVAPQLPAGPPKISEKQAALDALVRQHYGKELGPSMTFEGLSIFENGREMQDAIRKEYERLGGK